jgi:hypothetical protein
MRSISKDDRVALKHIFYLRLSQAVFAALWPIAIIPIEAVKFQSYHLARLELCTYNCVLIKIKYLIGMKFQFANMSEVSK